MIRRSVCGEEKNSLVPNKHRWLRNFLDFLYNMNWILWISAPLRNHVILSSFYIPILSIKTFIDLYAMTTVYQLSPWSNDVRGSCRHQPICGRNFTNGLFLRGVQVQQQYECSLHMFCCRQCTILVCPVSGIAQKHVMSALFVCFQLVSFPWKTHTYVSYLYNV